MGAPAEDLTSVPTEPPALPGLFLGYQARWFADRSQIKICTKSRQIGISWATAAEAVLVAGASKACGGMDVWYLSQSERDATEFTKDSGEWARAMQAGLVSSEVEEMLLQDGEQSILVTVIRFASGYRITILPGNRPNALRGKKGLVIFDEAALLDLELCRAAADAFKMWGGRLIFISTQSDEGSPWNKWLEDIAGGKGRVSVHKITLLDACNDGLYKRICLVKRQEWSEQAEREFIEDLLAGPRANCEYLCIPSRITGGYFGRDLVEARMELAPVLRLTLPERWELEGDEAWRTKFVDDWIESTLQPELKKLNPHHLHALGQDFGRAAKGDLSVLAPVAMSQTLDRKVPFLVELRGVPFEQQRQIHIALGDGLPKLIGIKIDQGGNGAYLAEKSQQHFGEHIVEKVSCGRPWYAEHVPRYKAALERGDMTIPKDADVLEDHMPWKVVDNIPLLPKKREKGTDGEQRHGDAAVALVLAFQASSMPAGKIESIRAPKAGPWARGSGRGSKRKRRSW